MKIAIVSLQFEETATGGGGVHVKNICEQFLNAGHEVIILSIHTNKTLPGAELEEAGETRYSIQIRGNLKILRFLIEEGIEHPYVHQEKQEELERIKLFAEIAVLWIKNHQEEYDVVNLQGHHLIPGYMAANLRGIKPKVLSYLHALETTYVTEKGDFVGAFKSSRDIMRQIREWEGMSRFADTVIGNSPQVISEFKDIIAEYEKIPENFFNRIKLIVSGCNKDFITNSEWIKNKLQHPPDVIKLVTFCRIDPSKGVQYSIKGAKAAAKLCRQRFQLLIAGIPASHDYIDQLKKEAENPPANLTIDFHFFDAISPLKEKISLLDDKHIYILPTLKEPFGMSVIEASARGNMIVSADTNGPKYMFDIRSGRDLPWGVITESGILAKITNDHEKYFAENIGLGVAWCVNNWQQSVLHVLNFRKKIINNWTWESISRQYLEEFKK